MGVSHFLCFAIASLLCLALVCPSHAQNSPQDYLNAHNAARRQVGVRPMAWDDKLATYARNYANKHIGDCKMVHSGGPYGENLAWSSGDMSGTAAVKMWVCGHYTQVVWGKSVRLGCAKVRCNSGGTFIVCSYDPRGNIVGQKPY
ncbi:hypothetical protein CRG98_030380 [Punica granatum]|uniref:SCP domain-containing protein n=1 Tax=Punica granatum TaxID=22663 RepID=A0A2I0IZ04_PUNGR|nr:hypothetical protein CRG98_030380 [Punica granatum]